MVFCSSCGAEVLDEHEYCNKCGERIKQGVKAQHVEPKGSKQLELKSEGTALVLAILLGLFGLWGIGQIYCSRIGRGIGMLIFGLVIIGSIWGFTIAFYDMSFSNILEDVENPGETGGLFLILLAFGIVYFGFFLYQIYDAKDLAREWNEYVESNNGERPW